MSREIKFRVWDEVIHDWHATKAIAEFTDRCTKGYNFNVVCFGNPKRTFIEQYTGLKDKNGKEIYEGDIIRYDAIDYVVVWTEFYACFEALRINNSYEYSLTHIAGFGSVIGNIHENPELLEGEK